jgi:hypothetical protein
MSTARQDSTPTRSQATPKRLELAEIGIRLLDEAHVAWQRAELECEVALQAWYERTPRTSGDGYASYLAALDREQAAAHDLQRLWELARSGHEALAAAASPAMSEPSA